MTAINVEEKKFDKAESQIRDEQRKVGFDVKEFTIEHIVNKYNAGEFFVPDYQRDFVWDDKRQSKFIESIVLGLPIPFIFVADVYGRNDTDDGAEGDLEIVDGSQRIRTLVRFIENKPEKTGFTESLKLDKLEVLDKLNGFSYNDFSAARKKRFLNSTIRMILISDKSDADVRFMMFERINTGSDELNAMEKRNGIYSGKFIEFIDECAKNELFVKLTSFTEKAIKRKEPQELILHFFAYSDTSHEVIEKGGTEFFDKYVKDKNKNGFNESKLKHSFEKMLSFVDANFENGFLRIKDSKKTPRLRFEAISIGVFLALKEKPNLKKSKIPTVDWILSTEFIDEISGYSSSTPKRIKSRCNFVKNKILGQ